MAGRGRMSSADNSQTRGEETCVFYKWYASKGRKDSPPWLSRVCLPRGLPRALRGVSETGLGETGAGTRRDRGGRRSGASTIESSEQTKLQCHVLRYQYVHEVAVVAEPLHVRPVQVPVARVQEVLAPRQRRTLFPPTSVLRAPWGRGAGGESNTGYGYVGGAKWRTFSRGQTR